MQLHLIFHKTVNRNKLKVWKSQNRRLSNFPVINKTVTGVEGEVGVISSFFLIITFICTYEFIYTEYILNSHKSLFIKTVNLLSCIALLISSHHQVNFSLYVWWIWINEFSPWQCLVLCLISIQERARKH